MNRIPALAIAALALALVRAGAAAAQSNATTNPPGGGAAGQSSGQNPQSGAGSQPQAGANAGGAASTAANTTATGLDSPSGTATATTTITPYGVTVGLAPGYTWTTREDGTVVVTDPKTGSTTTVSRATNGTVTEEHIQKVGGTVLRSQSYTATTTPVGPSGEKRTVSNNWAGGGVVTVETPNGTVSVMVIPIVTGSGGFRLLTAGFKGGKQVVSGEESFTGPVRSSFLNAKVNEHLQAAMSDIGIRGAANNGGAPANQPANAQAQPPAPAPPPAPKPADAKNESAPAPSPKQTNPPDVQSSNNAPSTTTNSTVALAASASPQATAPIATSASGPGVYTLGAPVEAGTATGTGGTSASGEQQTKTAGGNSPEGGSGASANASTLQEQGRMIADWFWGWLGGVGVPEPESTHHLSVAGGAGETSEEGPPTPPVHSVVGDVGDLAPINVQCNDTGCEFTPPSSKMPITITLPSEGPPIPGAEPSTIEIPATSAPAPGEKAPAPKQPPEQPSKPTSLAPMKYEVGVSYAFTPRSSWNTGSIAYDFTVRQQSTGKEIAETRTGPLPYQAVPGSKNAWTIGASNGKKVNFEVHGDIYPSAIAKYSRLFAQTALNAFLLPAAPSSSAKGDSLSTSPTGESVISGYVAPSLTAPAATATGSISAGTQLPAMAGTTFFLDAMANYAGGGVAQVDPVGQNMAMLASLVPFIPATQPPGETGPRHSAANQDSYPRENDARFELASFRAGEAPAEESDSQAAGQAAANAAPQIVYSFLANGNASGNAFKLRVWDPSGRLQDVRARDGLILQPLKRGAAPLEPRAGGKELTYEAIAFCVDYAKLPPNPEQLYRVAPPEVQAQYGKIGPVIRAGQELAAEGKLRRNDPAYKVLAQQYALWAQIGQWTEQQFTEVFLEKTKADAAKQNVQWTQQMEQSLLGIASEMWGDIQMIEQAAAKPAAGQPAEPPGPGQ